METSRLLSLFDSATGASIDSRNVKPGNVFFALKGERTDGHQFVAQALANGASYAVVSNPAMASDGVLVVEDTLQALQHVALEFRKQLSLPVLAITGSNGKTTTKELVHRVISGKYRTFATRGNLNNHIGVPLTLLSIPRDAEFAIVEMGANHIGEIAALCEMAMPHFGLITNIGSAHLEGFGGIEGVIQGKGELFEWLRRSKGIAFVNRDEDHLSEMASGIEHIVRYGFGERASTLPGEYTFVNNSVNDKLIVNFKGHDGLEYTVQSSLYGDYNMGNIATAVAVGLYFEVESDKIRSAIESYSPDNNRSQVIVSGDLRIVMDAYNANPTSMRKAIDYFRVQPGTKSLILGEMKEVGQTSRAEHIALLEYVRSLDTWDAVYLVGEGFRSLVPTDHWLWFENSAHLATFLEGKPISSGSVLVKGSRSVGLEKVLPVLQR